MLFTDLSDLFTKVLVIYRQYLVGGLIHTLQEAVAVIVDTVKHL